MDSPKKIPHFSLNSKINKDSEKDEEERTTMFHVVFDQMKEKIVLQRIIVTARLPHGPADVTELGDRYGNVISELNKQHIWEHITGLLVIYPTCILHVIESSRAMLNAVLRVMQQTDSVLLETKVVFMAHRLQSRLFRTWTYKVLYAGQVSSKAAVEKPEDDDTETLVCCVLSVLSHLEKHLATMSCPGPVLDEHPELIISQNILEKLLSRDELLSLQQHLEMYDSPLNISIEIGQVNPRAFLPTI